MHARLNIPDLVPLYQEYRDMPFVSISHAQFNVLRRHDQDVGINVLRKSGDVKIVVTI